MHIVLAALLVAAPTPAGWSPAPSTVRATDVLQCRNHFWNGNHSRVEFFSYGHWRMDTGAGTVESGGYWQLDGQALLLWSWPPTVLEPGEPRGPPYFYRIPLSWDRGGLIGRGIDEEGNHFAIRLEP